MSLTDAVSDRHRFSFGVKSCARIPLLVAGEPVGFIARQLDVFGDQIDVALRLLQAKHVRLFARDVRVAVFLELKTK